MSFDVVFDLAYDQRRELLEQSKAQRVGNSDLLCDRFFARSFRAVEQICSRLRAPSALFTFFPRQACA